jgi:succinate dehydrogenase / fumarate reductase cytochrome b subunit
MARRPLSPHLFIYRFAYTMSLSILHRITGLALAFGLPVLALWLVAVASSDAAYARLSGGVTGALLKILLAGWLMAFVYHLANGIRHLLWDAGIGLEKREARRSGLIVVAATVLSTAVLFYFLYLWRNA